MQNNSGLGGVRFATRAPGDRGLKTGISGVNNESNRQRSRHWFLAGGNNRCVLTDICSGCLNRTPS